MRWCLHQGAPLPASPVEYAARDPTSQVAVRIDEHHAPSMPLSCKASVSSSDEQPKSRPSPENCVGYLYSLYS
jgi:hypothetical protein